MNTRILPVLVLAFLVLGCGGDSGHDPGPSEPARDRAESGAAPASEEPATKVIVTSDDASLPDGCHPRQVAGLVIDFISAFNRGARSGCPASFSSPRARAPRISRREDIIRGPGSR